MTFKKAALCILVLGFLCLRAVPALAANQEFQLGYVFDAWNSNFIYHGQENRIPLTYKIFGDNYSFRFSTAFVLGDYEANAVETYPGAAFKSNDLSDSTLQGSLIIPMGGGLRSNLIGNLNIPTGNTNWEANAALGAIPYIFDSSYYHGRGLGGDLFYFINFAPANEIRWGVGLGYLRTTTYYNSGIDPSQTLTPWGALVGMATIGIPMGGNEDISFRVVHNLPFQSTAQYAIYPFTLGQSTEVSGQWAKKMGQDKLQVTVSFNNYDRGVFTDPTSYTFVQESQAFLGNRFEVRPFLGWVLNPGVMMETGLNWRHVVSNGYSVLQTNFYEGGGDLVGAQQSITFQLDSGAFLNFGGLYEYISNNNAAKDSFGNLDASVTYNRFTLGTNVGFKW